MKTYVTKKQDIERKWYLVDANDVVLGRLATVVADTLRGKNKPEFSPSVDCGDFVVVINTKKVKVTGNKVNDKKYYRHSGYPGGIKEETFAELLDKNPNKIVMEAVRGMLPKNKLASEIIGKLKLYETEEHKHEAQKPVKLEIGK